ncbi:AraC family transcriptional regulator [Streptomyces sp. VRA16 Mangrove soil]|uniref:AraC family transcriptional regulator n=1 Tax=Streptomyces sp. VRA16 Mangrove soil TaxID=2817434 RepID=UPI001A9D1207|nr:AraC family transcriptional regulator [Streptomyces sp. VRA16 Mangrove soil]MBO1336409.1 AraC family transcriptional regulator [Streptomyces sp. VRA16 Mangrove soil]
MDILSDAVAAMRLGRPHSALRDKFAPWGNRFDAHNGAGFHVLLRGTAWLLPEGDVRRAVRLEAGDVAFLAHGRGHALVSELDVVPEEFTLAPDGTWPAPPPRPALGPTPDAVMLCGAYQLDRSHAHPLLGQLPDVVHLPARVGAHRSVRAAVELLGEELDAPRPGSDTIVPALLDTLLLYILRAWWLEQGHDGAPASGWAAALTEPPLAAALHAVHGDPAHGWTVAELAALGGLSRAAFARRFAAAVGMPPLAYLTWWRMTTAGRLLREADLPLRLVAHRTGYTSEFAFAKAFKREFGVAPGQYRTAAAA